MEWLALARQRRQRWFILQAHYSTKKKWNYGYQSSNFIPNHATSKAGNIRVDDHRFILKTFFRYSAVMISAKLICQGSLNYIREWSRGFHIPNKDNIQNLKAKQRLLFGRKHWIMLWTEEERVQQPNRTEGIREQWVDNLYQKVEINLFKMIVVFWKTNIKELHRKCIITRYFHPNSPRLSHSS